MLSTFVSLKRRLRCAYKLVRSDSPCATCTARRPNRAWRPSSTVSSCSRWTSKRGFHVIVENGYIELDNFESLVQIPICFSSDIKCKGICDQGVTVYKINVLKTFNVFLITVRELKFSAQLFGSRVASPSRHLDRIWRSTLRPGLHRGITVWTQQHASKRSTLTTCFPSGACGTYNSSLSACFSFVLSINIFIVKFQKHDRKTHRLWFLWPPAITKVPPEVAGKCGCVGGCSFFGANCNGRNFFKPSRGDIDDRCNVAIPTIKDRKERPAYGQSILYDNVLVTSDCKWFRAFCVLGEQLLPPQWPYTCRKPSKYVK